MNTTTARLQQIAALHAEHARQLEELVARHARATPQTIEDACSYAWMQLLTHPCINVCRPCWSALAWLTQTAMREAWRLEADRAREELVDDAALERARRRRQDIAPAADEVADRHARLDLVAQLPERPRRFLLRLAMGFTYREIAKQENVSLTTTNKQIARAKRLLRELEAKEGGEHPPPGT